MVTEEKDVTKEKEKRMRLEEQKDEEQEQEEVWSADRHRLLRRQWQWWLVEQEQGSKDDIGI